MADNNEAVKIANALQPFARKCAKEVAHSCIRAKQMKIVTAPNADTGTVGVAEAFGTEIFIPYSSAIADASVGDIVWCVWMVDNAATMVAMWSGDLRSAGGGGQPGPPGRAATIEVGTVTTGEPGSDVEITNSGTSSDAVFNFSIPRGNTGAQGPKGSDGAAATITVGTVTTGAPGSNANVTNVGTSSAAKFDFTIPRGDTGETGPQGNQGDAATVSVGTVTTLPAGSQATVENVGTESDAVFNFGIPKGRDGEGTDDYVTVTANTTVTIANHETVVVSGSPTAINSTLSEPENGKKYACGLNFKAGDSFALTETAPTGWKITYVDGAPTWVEGKTYEIGYHAAWIDNVIVAQYISFGGIPTLFPPASDWEKVTGANYAFDLSSGEYMRASANGSNSGERTTSPITITAGVTTIHIKYRVNTRQDRQSQFKFTTLSEADKNVAPTNTTTWSEDASHMVNLNGVAVGEYEVSFTPSLGGQRYVAVGARYYYNIDVLKVWVTES